MKTTQIIHNGQLLGFIEYDGKRYTDIALGDEIICKNHDDATQAIYDAHEIQ
jgi:hypothetical protein